MEPLSRTEAPPRFLAIFFAIFALAGVLSGGGLCVAPATAVWSARSWASAECTITSSWVETHAADDGDTYSIEVRYRYAWDGVEHDGQRYDLSTTGSSSGLSGKEAVVASLPEGVVVPCWVDPAEPSNAVLDRDPGLFLLWGLFALPFIAIGFGGMFWVLRPRKARPVTGASATTTPSEDGPIELSRTYHPLLEIVGVLIFASIWDAVCTFMVVAEDGPPLLFTGIFLLAGAGVTFGALPYVVLRAFNPRPRLVLDSGRIGVGSTVQVLWTLDGNTSRMKHLVIRLEGLEKATYKRGTKTVTDTSVFHTDKLVDIEDGDFNQGLASVQIPVNTMHSFTGDHNAVEWQLVVEGDIPRWPDIAESFPITVRPFRA